jgi:L-aspartate oxidase
MSPPAPLIIGTGIAGLWAAWRMASEGSEAILLTKGTLADSATAWAQGGIAVALGPDDSPELHARDTLEAGDGLSDPEAVEILVTEGPERIRELLALGADFDRATDGRLTFGLEAAHTRPRILHADGDRTGAMLVRSLTAVVRHLDQITLLEHHEVRRLVRVGDRVTGAIVVGPDGVPRLLAAPAVVLATGGVGQLFEVTTNPLGATGDGWALAHAVGAELRDLEFLQFHPTALKLPGVNPAPLISEAVRGAGALLVDRSGKRFALDADPRGELAPRDIVAREVARADSGGGAFLDARGIADFNVQFPGIHAMLRGHGLDPLRDLLPVATALHYAMGGVSTDLDGRTSVAGLWAAGEVACTGVHGANRLASNSLLEGLVFADRVARAIVAEDAETQGRLDAETHARLAAERPVRGEGSDGEHEHIGKQMREIMTRHVGVVRTEWSLAEAGTLLGQLEERTPASAWRTRNQLTVAQLITQSARGRRESRGGHRRADYPPRRPERV